MEGVYGKKPFRLNCRISAQSQYDRGNLAVSLAIIAFSEIALNERPGGSIKPFCDDAIMTSTSHSSWRYSIAPREETASTINRAGCPRRFIIRRISDILLVVPVEVSLCTTIMALYRCPLSSDNLASIS